ncbi:MAG: membrane protein insertion efficiency factor YidD [Pseudomonadales bacterium]
MMHRRLFNKAARWLDRQLVRLLLWLIHGYQRLLSPMLGGQCRFHPTCSCYAAQALAEHGAVRGSGLTLWRLLRCQPFAAGGFDAVPKRTGPGDKPAAPPYNTIQES